MKTFSGGLDRGNFQVYSPAGGSFVDSLLNQFKSAFTSSFASTSSGVKMADAQVKYSAAVNKKQLYELMNNADGNVFYKARLGGTTNAQNLSAASKAENIYHIDKSIIDTMNWYNVDGGIAFNTSGEKYSYKDGDSSYIYNYISASSVVHSLFNPYYGLHRNGIFPGLKLTPGTKSDYSTLDTTLSDCSIKNLVKLSRKEDSILGAAKYKYADFMYCKDLGMPNNHLITLRKFATPVGDNIWGSNATIPGKVFGGATKKNSRICTSPDVGRMLCYFGGEDNKLEDILNFSFHATWKDMTSGIQQEASKEDDRESPLGRLINTFADNGQYNLAQGKSITGNNNIIDYAIQKISGSTVQSWYKDNPTLYNYDQHKIYEPKNTIQSMMMYEGKLEFSHDFTLVFSYKMRGYDNINQKSAFLDLLANIVNTTYRRGYFWGGRRQIIGPQPNTTGWNKANAFIDKNWSALGSFTEEILNGTLDFSGLLGKISNAASQVVDKIVDAGKKIANLTTDDLKEAGGKVVNYVKDHNIDDALKGKLKDRLGRPQLYAFNSLLTGDNTGLWHVTIGNPLNPIVSMGNLYIKDVKIQHLGPLGIDDFPTELKVSVTLSHARGRDAVDIQKMYTKGGDAIHIPHLGKDVYKNPAKVREYIGTSDADLIKYNQEQLS
jgi:hypothetical protein